MAHVSTSSIPLVRFDTNHLLSQVQYPTARHFFTRTGTSAETSIILLLNRIVMDLFENIISLEQQSARKGRTEGIQQGRAEGYAAGWNEGVQVGTSVSSELGFIRGFVEAWCVLHREEDEKSRRIAEKIIKLVRTFPNSENDYGIEEMQLIRSKFKVFLMRIGLSEAVVKEESMKW